MTYAVSFTASLPSYASAQTGDHDIFRRVGANRHGYACGRVGYIHHNRAGGGSHSITATYSGDSNYGPGTSGALTENIQDFTLAFASASGAASTPAGGHAAYTLVITPVDGATLPAGVSLSAANVPWERRRSFLRQR